MQNSLISESKEVDCQSRNSHASIQSLNSQLETKYIPPSEEHAYADNGRFIGDILKRVQSHRISQSPHDCIGLLRYLSQKREAIGTGFLIGPNLVLARANHFRNNQHEKAGGIYFYPGINGSLAHENLYRVIDVRVKKIYKRQEKQANNMFSYALLKLSTNIDKKEYLRLGVDWKYVEGQDMCIYGYNINHMNFFKFSILQAHQVGVQNLSDYFEQEGILYHKMNTEEGNSGSPILVKRQQEYIAIAIHCGSNMQYNQGLLCDLNMMFELQLMRKEMRCPPFSFCYMSDYE